ncbi:hypothetical protein CsSME_00029913 [Camellia sinensis var. sinensis]
MLLMYWLCEHTTILQPHKPNAFPCCVKWDLTALQKKMKTISLVDIGFNELMPANSLQPQQNYKSSGVQH